MSRLPHLSRRVAVSALGGVLLSHVSPAGAQSTVTINIGATLSDDTTAHLYAVDAGLYRRAGLNVVLQPLASGAAIAAAVVGGSLQIGDSSLLGIVTAHTRGIPFQYVVPGHIYRHEAPTELLIVRKDSPIQTARDMNGKTLGVTAVKDLLSTVALAWIDTNGGDSKTVKQIEFPMAAMGEAFKAGRVDAANLIEPILSQLLGSGDYRVLGDANNAVADRYLASAYVTTAGYATANPGIIQRYARVMREANQFANAHPDMTAPLLSAWTHVDAATIVRGKRFFFAETLLPADIQPVIDTAAKYKLIEKSFDAREIISPLVLNLAR